MLERYVLSEQTAAEREFLPARAWWKFAPKFNVAAQQYVPSIRVHDGQTEGLMARWPDRRLDGPLGVHSLVGGG
jgi:hypothetical protein